MKYRKKPVEVEARKWSGSAASAVPIINWILDEGGTARYHEDDDAHHEHIQIDTLEGTMRADVGDYIIQGVEREFYPCKPNIFDQTYEMAL